MQTAIPCLFMRGGTSRGPFFQASDLPADVPTRDRVLLSVMGSPDKRQIDGLGGAHPLTSKVGIVTKGSTPGVDLNFLFAQLQPDNYMLQIKLAEIYADGGTTVTVPFTQEDLAQLAGTTRPSANRVLRAGEAVGVVRMARGRIEVVDLEAARARGR